MFAPNLEDLASAMDLFQSDAAALERELEALRTLSQAYGWAAVTGWIVALAFAVGMLWQTLRLEGVL